MIYQVVNAGNILGGGSNYPLIGGAIQKVRKSVGVEEADGYFRAGSSGGEYTEINFPDPIFVVGLHSVVMLLQPTDASGINQANNTIPIANYHCGLRFKSKGKIVDDWASYSGDRALTLFRTMDNIGLGTTVFEVPPSSYGAMDIVGDYRIRAYVNLIVVDGVTTLAQYERLLKKENTHPPFTF